MPNAFRGHRIYFNEALPSLFTIPSFLLFWVLSVHFNEHFIDSKLQGELRKKTYTDENIHTHTRHTKTT